MLRRSLIILLALCGVIALAACGGGTLVSRGPTADEQAYLDKHLAEIESVRRSYIKARDVDGMLADLRSIRRRPVTDDGLARDIDITTTFQVYYDLTPQDMAALLAGKPDATITSKLAKGKALVDRAIDDFRVYSENLKSEFRNDPQKAIEKLKAKEQEAARKK